MPLRGNFLATRIPVSFQDLTGPDAAVQLRLRVASGCKHCSDAAVSYTAEHGAAPWRPTILRLVWNGRNDVKAFREVATPLPQNSTPFRPLCLSSYRASFVNSHSSVRVRPEAPLPGDHDVTTASRPVTAFVPVRIRLVTPISRGTKKTGYLPLVRLRSYLYVPFTF